MSVRDAALSWHDAGFAVLPTKTDGSKAPDVPTWKAYQHAAPTADQLNAWFSGGRPGLGLLCGAVSGNLEMLELEGRAVAEGALSRLQELIEQSELDQLWLRITAGGYVEKTPSGGIHLLYRVDGGPVPGNTKLANRPALPEELDEREREVVAKHPNRVLVRGLAETRGEGGYVVIAPSNGTTHPTGNAWTVIKGGPDTVPTITASEREQLHRLFRCLDTVPIPEPTSTRPLQVVRDGHDGVSPGDDFENKVPWDDELLLGGAGWRPAFTNGHTTYWRRPGKDTPGISATTGHDPARDRLYVFTSATEFPTETPLTKFGAYALLHHGNDFKAAARELRRLGYGSPRPERPAPSAPTGEYATMSRPTAIDTDGTSARVLSEPKPLPQMFGATQDGMAQALAEHHGNRLRYIPQRGKWIHWNGHQWDWDDSERHRELAKDVARMLPSDERDWKDFRRSCLSAAGVTGVTRMAQSDPRLVAHFDQLDANPWDLNTPGGIIDMRTGALRPPDPSALCTRSTTVALDQAADPRRWLEFLADTFGQDDALVSYLQRLVGYSAVGVVGAHVLPFAHGSGGNGKGVFLEALAGVLGDYATSAPNGFLMQQPFPGHETELARLAGARMVICSEVNEDDKFDEAKVKSLTGGDTVTARFMRQDHFSFRPTHQLWLMGNHQPAVRSGGRSFWRRLRLIPFEHEVPEDKMVDDLQGKLIRDHGPALLAWIAAGAAAYAAGGLKEPDSVKAATSEYAHDQDSVARFVEECCHVGGGENVTIKVSKFREAYEGFCYAEGMKPSTAKKLTMELERRYQALSLRTRAARLYGNITLMVDESSERDTESGW